MKPIKLALPLLLATLASQTLAQRFDGDAEFPNEGRFYQVHLLQMGMEHGNPKYKETDNWFRVNSPQVSLMESIKHRYETRYNGLMMIWAEADITSLAGAELYLEVWGGHPGTYNKRVSVNGRSTYDLPEVGSAARHCTHSYPTIVLQPSDLVNGYNAFQFSCRKDAKWGWGHYILHDARLRLVLSADHPTIKAEALEAFRAEVTAKPDNGNEGFRLELAAPTSSISRIRSVSYQAFYDGYDENGNGLTRDWHGLTHRREDQAFAARTSTTPFSAFWDTSMLPGQSQIAVRAIVRFEEPDNLIYITPPTGGLATARSPHEKVLLHSVKEGPVPFWSRASRLMSCDLELASDRILRAELHIAVWGGNSGTVEEYFTLNGHFVPVEPPAGTGPIWYHRLEIPPAWLVPGPNRIQLLSDTEHHGIEVLRPGPALMVRYRE